MRIVFLGGGLFGLPTLERVADEHELALVVSQPDRPAGRKRKLTPTPVAERAQERGWPLVRPPDVNTEEGLGPIRDARPDALVVVAFGQKVSETLIEMPAHGPRATMNLHASLLPKYRGAAPVNWAILCGERETGNTLINMTSRMDAGDVLGWQRTDIGSLETAGELHDRLATLGPDVVLDGLEKLASGNLQPVPQDESQATRAPKLSRADATLDLTDTAEAVQRRVHGLTPWPGVRLWWSRGGEAPRPLLLRRVEALPETRHDKEPGELLGNEGWLAVGGGAVRLIEVQPPGKRTMGWDAFQRGHGLSEETRFRSGPPTDE